VILTHEPGGTPDGEKIRELLLKKAWDHKTETLLFFADRAEHVQRCIVPALQQGTWVICDRFIDSTFVYQGHGRGVDETLLSVLTRWVVGTVWPTLTFLLDLPVPMALARTSRDDAIASEDEFFFERIRTAYLRRAQADPSRMIVIDAAQPLAAVQQNIVAVLQEKIP
jgi:dTMP kinase